METWMQICFIRFYKPVVWMISWIRETSSWQKLFVKSPGLSHVMISSVQFWSALLPQTSWRRIENNIVSKDSLPSINSMYIQWKGNFSLLQRDKRIKNDSFYCHYGFKGNNIVSSFNSELNGVFQTALLRSFASIAVINILFICDCFVPFKTKDYTSLFNE